MKILDFVPTTQVVTICKAREYDFLDFRNEKFNTDFVDFNRKVVSNLENKNVNRNM